MARPTGGRRPGSDGGVQWGRALAVIIVLVVIGVVVLNRTGTSGGGSSSTTHKSAATTTASTQPAPTTTTPLLPESQIKVQVLNGVLTGALAGQWSAKLKTQYGYATQPPDDATSKVGASVVYILTPGYQAEANRLAAQVGLSASAVNPTVPAPASAPIKATERAGANLVLIIGPDLAGTA